MYIPHSVYPFTCYLDTWGCFHLLATVNNATMTCPSLPSIPLATHLGMEPLGHVAVPHVNPSHAGRSPTYICTSNAQKSWFPYVLAKYLLFSSFLENSHLDMCEVIFHCGNLFLKHKRSTSKSMEERQHFSTNGAGTNGQPYGGKKWSLIQTHTLHKH